MEVYLKLVCLTHQSSSISWKYVHDLDLRWNRLPKLVSWNLRRGYLQRPLLIARWIRNSFLDEFARILKSVLRSRVPLVQIYCLRGFEMILKTLFLTHFLTIIDITITFRLFQVLILLDGGLLILILSFFKFILPNLVQFKHLLC